MTARVRRAAASTVLAPLLGAPHDRTGRVAAVFPTAVYVELDDGDVLAVETHDALRLPCALVLAERSAARPWGDLRPGERACVGSARLDAGPLRVTVARWWAPRRPRPLLGTTAAGLPALLPPLDPSVAAAVGPLRDWLQAPPDAARGRDAVRRLLGLGPGLTPAGDDVLAGALVALAAATCGHRHPLGEAVDEALPGRTTALSAALLRHACHGLAVPALVDLVDALGDPRVDDLPVRVDRLLAVGHSSGAALAHGVALALTTIRPLTEVA